MKSVSNCQNVEQKWYLLIPVTGSELNFAHWTRQVERIFIIKPLILGAASLQRYAAKQQSKKLRPVLTSSKNTSKAVQKQLSSDTITVSSQPFPITLNLTGFECSGNDNQQARENAINS